MKGALLIAIGAILVGSALSIKCWECKSHADPLCADPFDNTTLPITECNRRTLSHMPTLVATMCRKIRQKVNGNWRVIRSCAYLGEPGEGHGDENYCLMRRGTFDVFVETCTCNSKDGCNAGHNSTAASPLVLLIIAAIAAMAKGSMSSLTLIR
ncbi:uncharacterized protein LOC111260969 [Varroa jacobsoni]|uniref:Protein sleepless n=1 Tax=Varroa destructor TaxID=109461 RepID=A0A7M7J581_VARDE|nr:uncharacterized protein LOC111243326 [Varroa destructor]XP_022644426.1 uncharacterized protein LOC111243326 [Varroa destructor]XP_022689831.1 uncharacterized protein LOC111260969 [Varroa jacobsoni]XP_022689832.1 uncharacterized protein LOC111260969 [Varroa jacobsoni]XP_022689833.1 uncharacterized protein LOC111260969 [Varroa jacobsoni]